MGCDHIVDGAPLLATCVAGCFIIYLDKPSKLATTFSFANLEDVFANLESARRDLSFGTLFVHQGLLVTALQGGPPLLGDPDLSYNATRDPSPGAGPRRTRPRT